MAQLPPPPRPYGAARRFQILEAAFDLYKRCFVPFVLMAAVIMLPLNLAQSYVSLEVLPDLEFLVEVAPDQYEPGEDFGRVVLLGIATAVGGMLASLLLVGALTRAAVTAVAGERATVGRTFAFAIRRFHSLLWISLLTGLLVLGGMVLLIVPGIIALVRSLLAMPAFVLEDRRGSKAIRRSFELTRGEAWMVFGIYLLAVLVSIVVGVVLTAPIPAEWVAQGLASGLAAALIEPFIASVVVFMYLDLRARREGLDREGLVAELSANAAAPAGALPPPPAPPPSPFG